MAKTLQSMKRLSNEMFDAELARYLEKEMQQEQREALSVSDDAFVNEGIASLFLPDNRFYRKTKIGEFTGLPKLVWNGLFDDDGKPKFVFIPDVAHPFSFTSSWGRTITPGLMDTDGGSIPKMLHSFGKFDPWTYALGYIIHDWIFIAHKCGHGPDDDITFDESATLLAECIKTMMEVGFVDFDGETKKFKKRTDTMYLIYKAVASPLAKRIWDRPAGEFCRSQT